MSMDIDLPPHPFPARVADSRVVLGNSVSIWSHFTVTRARGYRNELGSLAGEKPNFKVRYEGYVDHFCLIFMGRFKFCHFSSSLRGPLRRIHLCTKFLTFVKRLVVRLAMLPSSLWRFRWPFGLIFKVHCEGTLCSLGLIFEKNRYEEPQVTNLEKPNEHFVTDFANPEKYRSSQCGFNATKNSPNERQKSTKSHAKINQYDGMSQQTFCRDAENWKKRSFPIRWSGKDLESSLAFALASVLKNSRFIGEISKSFMVHSLLKVRWRNLEFSTFAAKTRWWDDDSRFIGKIFLMFRVRYSRFVGEIWKIFKVRYQIRLWEWFPKSTSQGSLVRWWFLKVH
jgi:hypothetical protein